MLYFAYGFLGVLLTIFSACSGGGSNSGNHHVPPCNGANCDPTQARVLAGAVIYVTPRNNEIIPNGDYNWVYNIDFLVDRTTTGSQLTPDIQITVPNINGGGTQQIPVSALTVTAGNSPSPNYYSVSFMYPGNQATPQALIDAQYIGQVQICSNGACSGVSQVDVTDTKLSVGFEANSRQGFGYGLYVSLLMPDHEMQPVNASTFFSHVNSDAYPTLTPLLAWSEVDWEFVPMNSTLAGRNEFLLCPDPMNIQDQPFTTTSVPGVCGLYWINMGQTPTAVPFLAATTNSNPGATCKNCLLGYTFNGMIAASGAKYTFGASANTAIPSFDALETYLLSANDCPTPAASCNSGNVQYQSFDSTPHPSAINVLLMDGITGFSGTGQWDKVSDPNFQADYPNAYNLRKHFWTLNIIHSPYGKPATAGNTRGDLPTSYNLAQIPAQVSFLGNNYYGHGLMGTEVYNNLLKNTTTRSLVGTAYSHPTGVISPAATPYSKFYYYAVNYTPLTMDFYVIDPADPRLSGGALDNTNISKFTPVRSFPIRNASTDQVTTTDASGFLIDHDYYGLMKFGLDEPNPVITTGSAGEGCNVPIYSYGVQGGFCSLKWQIQTWLIAGLAGSEYASNQLIANSYLRKIAVYDNTKIVSTPLQLIDFTTLNNNPGQPNYWRYQFQKQFAIGYAMGPTLGDGTSYATKGFWNLTFGPDPVQSQPALIFTQMYYDKYLKTEQAQNGAGNYLYSLTASTPKTQVVLDAPNYAYAAVDNYQNGESDSFSVPVGQTAKVTVYPLIDTSAPITLGAASQTCTLTFNVGGTVANSCAAPKFTVSPISSISLNLNAPTPQAAQMTGCSGGRCTFTVSWTSPETQYPTASLFIVPNQQWVSTPANYYQDLVTGGALVSANQTSATFTVDQKYVGPQNPNVTIYACAAANNSCPNAGNQYSIAGIPGKGSTNGFDLQSVGTPAIPTVIGQTISTTWTNANNQDPEAKCYLYVNNLATPPSLNHATGTYLGLCSSGSGSITFDDTVTVPTKPGLMVVSCSKNSYIDTCPDASNNFTPVSTAQTDSTAVGGGPSGPAAPLAPTAVNPATVSSCSGGTCQFAISWTNPAVQYSGTNATAQYFIVPTAQWLPACTVYNDMFTAGALVDASFTSTTLTLNQNYVGSTNPNVEIFACCSGTGCPPNTACPTATSVQNICGTTCNTFTTQATCPAAAGCQWNAGSSTCALATCSTYTQATSCNAVASCQWNTTSSTCTPQSLVSGLPAMSSTGGEDLTAITATSATYTSHNLTIKWTNLPSSLPSGAYCYPQITGVPVRSAQYASNAVVPCSNKTITVTDSSICNTSTICKGSPILPPGTTPTTVGIGICFKTSFCHQNRTQTTCTADSFCQWNTTASKCQANGSSWVINSCPDNSANYTDNGLNFNTPSTTDVGLSLPNIGGTTVSY